MMIVMIGILNEKYFHIQSDIALILFSLILSLILLAVGKLLGLDSVNEFVTELGDFGFEE